ncbi:MAG: fibronectin [Candidatus Marinimicrobia bacterium]|nr:fibronectin [Candidatus Neomarinimicrobiota bacterium]
MAELTIVKQSNKTTRIIIRTLLLFSVFSIFLPVMLSGQGVGESERRYVRIGSLQSHISSYGSERAWNNSYYEGLRWPADYKYTDNAVIKRSWIAAKDFTDEDGQHWDTWATYLTKGYVKESIFPVRLDQTTKFVIPNVLVDNKSVSGPYSNDWDGDPDASMLPDRIITNTINTSLGLSFTRRVLVFSQQYHDNYFIKEIIIKNTGNVDYDDDIELSETLHDVRVGWGTRYSVCREAGMKVDGNQSWGKFTWVSRRGEDYAQHVDSTITESNPIVDWLRCGFSWLGQSDIVSFDNIGGPDWKGNGRLTSPQFVGTAVLHVDKSVTDRDDDPFQPAILGWHAGDEYPSLSTLGIEDTTVMERIWDFLAGSHYPSDAFGGTGRFFEENTDGILDPESPYTVHQDGGGTNVWITYGPFTIPHKDSIVIVEVEGIAGLNRQMCDLVGSNWLKELSDLPLPEGGTTDDPDLYKNSWVYTGVDSILQTFGRALRNYRSGYKIPLPPEPPTWFNVSSGGDKIALTWGLSPDDGDIDFAGYKIFRAIGKVDTTYEEIYTAAPGEDFFEDTTPARGQAYHYYIQAFNDGSNNPGVTNPAGPLYSSKFYTRTTRGAFLKRQSGTSFDQIRVVPNPFHIAASRANKQYVENFDRIMFYDIPGKCKIRIFTERGDLVEEIEHMDGSGDHAWDSLSSSRQVVVSGIYIAHFEVVEDIYDSTTDELVFKKGNSTLRKFVIIR